MGGNSTGFLIPLLAATTFSAYCCYSSVTLNMLPTANGRFSVLEANPYPDSLRQQLP